MDLTYFRKAGEKWHRLDADASDPDDNSYVGRCGVKIDGDVETSDRPQRGAGAELCGNCGFDTMADADAEVAV